MAINCAAASLAVAAIDFDRLSDRELMVVQTYLLAQIANGVNTALPTDAKTLQASAVAFAGLSNESLLEMHAYLLCQIASASGA
jgi:hypothetical protein